MVDYIIISTQEAGVGDPSDLQDKVNEKIKEGYIPIGGLSVRVGTAYGAIYHQSMVKTDDLPFERVPAKQPA